MDKERFQKAHRWVRSELAGSADFWLRHGFDREHGGVYTCLDRKGDIFSTDKSVWMQDRCGWIYAFLHAFLPWGEIRSPYAPASEAREETVTKFSCGKVEKSLFALLCSFLYNGATNKGNHSSPGEPIQLQDLLHIDLS